jgi:hypothetical protein
VQKSSEVVPFSSKPRGTPANLNRGPAGNKFAEKHGFYSAQMTAEESADRAAWVTKVIAEKGDPSETERTLIETASWLRVKTKRVWRAIEEGHSEPAHEHVLATVNSLRLILCALGLERRSSPAPSLREYLAGKKGAL